MTQVYAERVLKKGSLKRKVAMREKIGPAAKKQRNQEGQKENKNEGRKGSGRSLVSGFSKKGGGVSAGEEPAMYGEEKNEGGRAIQHPTS